MIFCSISSSNNRIFFIDNAILIPIVDNIVLTCNSITIQLRADQFMNRYIMFMSPFGTSHMGNPPQSLPCQDITDWFYVSSEHILFIKTGIYWLQVLKLLFHTKTTGAWFLLVIDSMTDGISFVLESSCIRLGLPQKIGVLEHMLNLILLLFPQSALYIC